MLEELLAPTGATMRPPPASKAAAQLTAGQYLRHRLLALDVETTGLGEHARVVSIGIVDRHGRVELQSLVRPGCSIPPEATAVHGITNAMVRSAPTLADLWPDLATLLDAALIVAYNASYDLRVLDGHARSLGLGMPWCDWWCVMRAYAAYAEVPRWKSLGAASQALGLPFMESHEAVTDARAALSIMRAMAAGR